MGSFAHVIVEADEPADTAALLGFATARLWQLEQLWSRFLPDSEISRLNRASGRPMVVSGDTFAAIELAVRGWEATAGRFDPCVLPALTAGGYDRSFEQLAPASATGGAPVPSTGCRGIELDAVERTVCLPPDVALDLGGIGKGLAADDIADMLIDEGADSVCVNLGGDIATRSRSGTGTPWTIGIAARHELDEPGDDLTSVALVDGSMATSAKTRRRWRKGDEDWHHLIDPSTGRSTSNDLAAVTVLSRQTAWAEVLTKAAFVAGPVLGQELVAATGAAGLFVSGAGDVIRVGGFERFEV